MTIITMRFYKSVGELHVSAARFTRTGLVAGQVLEIIPKD